MQSASIRNITAHALYSRTDQLCVCRRQSGENCRRRKVFGLVFVVLKICLETSGFVKGYKVSIRIIGDKLCIGNRISLLKPCFLEKVIK
jgi:hypothetical protein